MTVMQSIPVPISHSGADYLLPHFWVPSAPAGSAYLVRAVHCHSVYMYLARPRVELRDHIHFDWKIYTMAFYYRAYKYTVSLRKLAMYISSLLLKAGIGFLIT